MNKLAPIALALLCSALPARASASHCESCNDGLPTQVEIGPSNMPPEGVVMVTLIDENGWLLGEEWWEQVTIEVRDSAGVLVEGALELDPLLTPGVWRPAQPWQPEPHTVTVIGGVEHECQLVDVVGSFEGVAETARPPVPEIVFEDIYTVSTSRSIENYVCCDGAEPYAEAPAHGACPGTPSYDVVLAGGYCTRAQSRGSITVLASLDERVPSRFTIRETTRDARPANSSSTLSVAVTQTACLDFEVIDLVTGERQHVEHCVAEQPGSPLGLFEYPDAAADIAAECEGPAYVCEGRHWNVPEECTLWPSGEPLPPDESLGDTDGTDGTDGTDDDTDASQGRNSTGDNAGASDVEGDEGGCRLGPRPHSTPVAVLLLVFAGARRRRVSPSTRGES